MIPFIALGILFAFLFLVYFYAVVRLTAKLPDGSENCDIGLKRFWVPALVTVLVWLALPFVYEFSGWPESVPVTFDKEGGVVQHSYGMFTVGLDGEYSNLPKKTFVKVEDMSVTILTDNPKVRKIKHHVVAELSNPNLFFKNETRRYIHDGTSGVSGNGNAQSVMGEVVFIVKCEIYNFNNLNSREMTNFFNPLDRSQQHSYEVFIGTNLNQVLEKDGVAVRRAWFSIEE